MSDHRKTKAQLIAELEALRQQVAEQEKLIAALEAILTQEKRLYGLLTICVSCKKIRNEHGNWQRIEVYLPERTDVEFSHGLCPDCAKELYPDYPLK
ncbi:MAG: hypothetical protein U0401_25490 [Anaerolineae bacterium]